MLKIILNDEESFDGSFRMECVNKLCFYFNFHFGGISDMRLWYDLAKANHKYLDLGNSTDKCLETENVTYEDIDEGHKHINNRLSMLSLKLEGLKGTNDNDLKPSAYLSASTKKGKHSIMKHDAKDCG